MDFGPIGPSAGCDGGGGGGDDSLRGLVFGKKIYFEDGSGGGNKALPARKGRGVLQGGGGGGGRQQQAPPRPRCQVEGCEADLSGVKAYYCRHKVCGMHSKAPKVIVGGIEQRFCQQCSRFHQLTEFDQGKRSCRRRLAGHNERRRKPPSGPFNSRYGQFPRSFHEPSRFRSFLMDFSYPKHGRDICSDNLVAGNQWHELVDAPWNAVVPVLKAHPYSQGSPGQILLSSPELPPGECLAGALDGSCALSLLSSTQPWGSNASRSQAPSISSSSSFNPFSNNYMANSWGSRDPGSRSHSQETEPLNEPGDRAHFSGELELALQGSRQYLEHGYGHSDHMIHHWSL